MNSFDLIKPVRISEKGTMHADKFNRYTVVSDRRANKSQIKTAVEELFKVKVTGVNTQNVGGKLRRQMTKAAGQDPDWKKAIVTLKKGDKIILT